MTFESNDYYKSDNDTIVVSGLEININDVSKKDGICFDSYWKLFQESVGGISEVDSISVQFNVENYYESGLTIEQAISLS